MSSKVKLLVLGIVVGGAIGWFTAPRPAVDISVGGVNVQVAGSEGGGSMKATDQGGSMQVAIGQPGGFLPDAGTRTAVFAVIGGIIGLGAGFLADRRRIGA